MVISNVKQLVADLGLAAEYVSHYTAVCVESDLNGYTIGEEYTVICGVETITEAQAKFSDYSAGDKLNWSGVVGYSDSEGYFVSFNGARGFTAK